MRADAVKLLAPEFGMRLLDRGEPAVNLLQARIALCVRKGAVERGAVDLSLQIGAVTRCGVVIWHPRNLRRTGGFSVAAPRPAPPPVARRTSARPCRRGIPGRARR